MRLTDYGGPIAGLQRRGPNPLVKISSDVASVAAGHPDHPHLVAHSRLLAQGARLGLHGEGLLTPLDRPPPAADGELNHKFSGSSPR